MDDIQTEQPALAFDVKAGKGELTLTGKHGILCATALLIHARSVADKNGDIAMPPKLGGKIKTNMGRLPPMPDYVDVGSSERVYYVDTPQDLAQISALLSLGICALLGKQKSGQMVEQMPHEVRNMLQIGQWFVLSINEILRDQDPEVAQKVDEILGRESEGD